MHVVSTNDTTRQWDLIAAAVEEANIEHHQLVGREAKQMKGRSKIVFKNKTKDCLEGIEAEDENAELVSKAKWTRHIADVHTALGNKLINVARRIKANGRLHGSNVKKDENKMLIGKTIQAYQDLAAKHATKHQLNANQKKQIEQQWIQKGGIKGCESLDLEALTKLAKDHTEEVQQAAQEFKEIHEQIGSIDTENPISSAKLTRLGEMHINKAKAFSSKFRQEIKKAKRRNNDCKIKGLKNISRAIGQQPARPLTCVCRDEPTIDGGKVGEITTNPREVDAIVKRAWKKIYDGVGGCIQEGVDVFLEKYCNFIYKSTPTPLQPMDAQMVYESFGRTKASAGAMDGWMPKEMSLLSLITCGHIATMLCQIEDGAPWPKSSTHARIVYLEKS